MLVNFILTDSNGDDPGATDETSTASAARSLFSSEMLSLLASAQKVR
jgi:hypothetical protein